MKLRDLLGNVYFNECNLVFMVWRKDNSLRLCKEEIDFFDLGYCDKYAENKIRMTIHHNGKVEIDIYE